MIISGKRTSGVPSSPSTCSCGPCLAHTRPREPSPDSWLWGAQPLVGFPGSPSCEASSPADSSADAPAPTLAMFCPCTVFRRLALHDPVSLLT